MKTDLVFEGPLKLAPLRIFRRNLIKKIQWCRKVFLLDGGAEKTTEKVKKKKT